MDELLKLREQVNEIDDGICKLYLQRLDIIRKIGKIKKDRKMSLDNPSREEEIFSRLAAKFGDAAIEDIKKLYVHLFMLSKEEQHKAR